MVTLPESFKELQALVYLEMHHCPNLMDVQGLPWSLESLGLGDCPKLIDTPSLRNLYLLKSLILCNCTSLTQLQDLESLCCNPTLAKCGGEAQHLEKLEVRSLAGLLNVQSSTTRGKTPRIGVFLVSLERS